MASFSHIVIDYTPPRRPWHWGVGLPVAAFSMLAGAGVLWALIYLFSTAAHLPAPKAQEDVKLTTVIYAADSTELARYYRENRTWVDLSQTAPAVRHALIATEDHRFFDHAGVDWRRLVTAVYHTLRGNRQGGSTITMQLIRNRYNEIAQAPLLERKVKEILMALKIEGRHDKEDILEAYLNTVSFGRGAFGIEAAAHAYFNKPANALDAPEAALLVGLLKGPTRYSPTAHPVRAKRRRNLVLRLMHRRGYLSAAERKQAHDQPLALNLHVPSLSQSPAPYFTEQVRLQIEAWAAKNGHNIYTDGLRVYTTLDTELQHKAQTALRRQTQALEKVAGYEWSRPRPGLLSEDIRAYERRADEGYFNPFSRLWELRPDVARRHIRRTARYRRALQHGTDSEDLFGRLRSNSAFMDSLRREVARLEAGLVALDPATGNVKAWVGGRNFKKDQYDHVALAHRQPGSTFKPFLYATAIDQGYGPYDLLRGDSLFTPYPGRPVALGEEGLTLRDGLAYSINRMALKLIQQLGPPAVAQTAHLLGVESPLDEVPSLALGTSEVTLLEMTSAYATLATHGIRHPSHLITRIESAKGRLLARFRPEPRKVLSRSTAYTTLDMMRGVVDRGTAFSLRQQWDIRADVAGKTGTTQENADGWFLMMHPGLVVGAWVGFNDQQIAFRTKHWGYGSHNALRVVGDFFGRVLETRPRYADMRFAPPPGYRTPRPPRTADSSYVSYETVDDSYGADDRYVPDAFRLGLDSTRGEAPFDDRLARQDTDLEQAFRAQTSPSDITDRTRLPTQGTQSDPSRRPAPIYADSLDSRLPRATQTSSPAPIHPDSLDPRLGSGNRR